MLSFVRSAYFPTNAKTFIVLNTNINFSQATTHTRQWEGNSELMFYFCVTVVQIQSLWRVRLLYHCHVWKGVTVHSTNQKPPNTHHRHTFLQLSRGSCYWSCRTQTYTNIQTNRQTWPLQPHYHRYGSRKINTKFSLADLIVAARPVG